LAGVAAGDEEVDAEIHAMIQEGARDCAAEFLYGNACAVRARVGGIASRTKALGGNVFELGPRLQMKGKLLDGSKSVEDCPRRFRRGLP
jgi:hypothetical protein